MEKLDSAIWPIKVIIMPIGIPLSLKEEHAEIHGQLAKLKKVPGKVGDAAKTVAKVLHPHFLLEEEIAMPLLGLLSPLAEDRIISEIEKATVMSNRLKAELAKMLKEHGEIVAVLKGLEQAIQEEGVEEGADFPEKLKQHAKIEEEVLYPAAILVGEFIKLKFPKETILA